MGWLYSSRWSTKSSLIHYLTREQKVGGENSTRWMKTLAKCVRGGTLYAAMEVSGDNLPDQRFLVVVLMKKSEGGWGYKDMEESDGPNESNCPPSYFDLVGPPPNESAREWRERCRAKAAKRTQKVNNWEYWYTGTNPGFFRVLSAKPLTAQSLTWGSRWAKYRLKRGQLLFQFWNPEWATGTVKTLVADMAMRLVSPPRPGWLEQAKILADAMQDVGANEDVCRCLRDGGEFCWKLVEAIATAMDVPSQRHKPLMATFIPQRWDADYARSDGDEVEFDATENLLSMELEDIRSFRFHSYDSDWLADGLPARDEHSGPFEVSVELDDWLHDCGVQSRKEMTEEQLERLRNVFGVRVTQS